MGVGRGGRGGNDVERVAQVTIKVQSADANTRRLCIRSRTTIHNPALNITQLLAS